MPDTCLQLLQAMVRFDTVNTLISGRRDAELALSRYLEERARELGFETRRFSVSGDGFNLLVSHPVRPAAPWLLFESHLDTVSVEGMTVEPFSGKVESGRVYGRGTCDTKGSGAAMLHALRDYASAPGPNNVGILYTLDEECSRSGVRRFLARDVDTLGWRPVGVVVGEPTELRLVVAHTGVVRWTLRSRGVAAHSSDPSRGRSAIRDMVRVVEALETEYISRLTASHPLTGPAHCSINVIRGGTQTNIIPENCEIDLDRRLAPGEDPLTVLPAVEEVLDRVRGAHPGITVEQGEPYITGALDPAISEVFASVVSRTLQRLELPAERHGVSFGTHANEYTEGGIPAVVLGPGSIAQAHTADEWLALEQLEGAVKIYTELMRSDLA